MSFQIFYEPQFEGGTQAGANILLKSLIIIFTFIVLIGPQIYVKNHIFFPFQNFTTDFDYKYEHFNHSSAPTNNTHV